MRYCERCQASVSDPAAPECPTCGRDAPSRGWPSDPLLDTTVAGRYRLEARLGAGGMGTVYRASDRAGRAWAVKVLHPWLTTSDDMVRRFRREARAAALLRGPHAVRIEEHGELADGALFLAMELVQGPSLSQRLHRTGWLQLHEGLALLLQLAEGLSEAHAAGLVHRDLKPENVLLEPAAGTPPFRARILDFGIVKHLDASLGTVGQTATGRVFGTPEYMSPEQARGDANLDHRSDVYSLGVCAFLWWTGRLPFEGESPQAVMVARLTRDPPPLSEARPGRRFPPGVDALVARMLAREPAERPATMDEVAAAARALLAEGEAPVAPTQELTVAPALTPAVSPPPVVAGAESGRRRMLAYAAAGLGFLVAMWAVAWLLRP